jgi:dienelactone hydrolase
MYMERTNYFAKPGMAEAVLQIRRDACAVRVSIGLDAGTVYVRLRGEEAGPDVSWQCHYASLEAQEEDLAARDRSPAFAAVRARMHAAIDRVERHFFRADGAGLLRQVDLKGVPIVPRAVTFSSGELELAGYLYLPPGDGPFPCMIVNHGSGIDRGTWDVCRPGMAATLMSWGIAVFMPHRRGYGNSPGPSWREEAAAEFGSPEYDEQLVARLDRESQDVLAALEFVQSLPEILADHVGVMGSSFGGVNTLLGAARESRFRCAVEFAGAAMNWEHTTRLRDFLTAAAARVSQPIFYIQAANDYSTGPTHALSEATRRAGGRVQAKVYPAFGLTPMEGHLFAGNGSIIWGEDVRGFLETWL